MEVNRHPESLEPAAPGENVDFWTIAMFLRQSLRLPMPPERFPEHETAGVTLAEPRVFDYGTWSMIFRTQRSYLSEWSAADHQPWSPPA